VKRRNSRPTPLFLTFSAFGRNFWLPRAGRYRAINALSRIVYPAVSLHDGFWPAGRLKPITIKESRDAARLQKLLDAYY
jgi:hypothetical protein